ncbi:MAG TPA: helix-turn-helix transcriptional regulator [Solirubrobacteraceae bacterium]
MARTIRRLREQAATTQEDLAHEAGITTGTLSKIERADSNPSWTTIERIACALKISLVELAQAVEGDAN